MLLAASDLVVSKAGGLIVSEALARGLPLIIPTAQLVGQERWNAAYVIEAQAGLGCAVTGQVAEACAALLAAPERLAALSAAALALGQPEAAAQIATRVLADLAYRQHGAVAADQVGHPMWRSMALQ